MNCQSPHIVDIGLTRVFAPMIVVLSVSLAFGAFQHPIASSDALAAGSDALLERGVVPPTQLDWIVMDCSDQSTTSRLRKSVCEVSKSVQALN